VFDLTKVNTKKEFDEGIDKFIESIKSVESTKRRLRKK